MMRPATLALLFLASLASAQEAPKRGSPEEKAAFEKHLLPSQKKPKAAAKPSGYGAMSAGAPKAAAAAITPAPDPNTVEYWLAADAEVTVQILAADGKELRRLSFPSGALGGRRGLNTLSLWDGRDDRGRPAPAGDYVALLSIEYAPDASGPLPPETRTFPLQRKSP